MINNKKETDSSNDKFKKTNRLRKDQKRTIPTDPNSKGLKKSVTKKSTKDSKLTSTDKELKKYNDAHEKVIEKKMTFLEEVLGREIAPYQQERIKVVALEIMHGLSPQQICNKYADKWGIGASSINVRVMKDARKFIASQILTDDNDIRLDLTAKYYFLYQKNMELNDLPESRKVLDSLSNLIKKIEHRVDVINNIETILIEEHKGNE